MMFVFVFNLFSFVITNAAPIIPGLSWIGSPINILNGFDTFGTVLDFRFSGRTTFDGNYALPDRLSFVQENSCSYNSYEFTSETYSEYQKTSTLKYSIGGSFGKFTGAYTGEHEQIKRNIFKNNEAINVVTAKCTQYQLKLPRLGSQLKTWFINELKMLPNNIDTINNKKAYFDIFKYYGTHIITGCNIGGELNQISFTKKDYIKKHGQTTSKQNAKATFYITLDGSKSNTITIDNEYKTSTTTQSIKTTGGVWPNTLDNWNPWMQSIQKLQQIACINWSAIPITDIFDWDTELFKKKSVAYQALDMYFTKVGCINPLATNYDRFALVQGPCDFQRVPEFRICFKEIEGSSQCQGNRNSCSYWSSIANRLDTRTWTAWFRDDTDGRGGGCKYQWKIEGRKSVALYKGKNYKYRLCFKETEGSSQCQGHKNTCSGWNNEQKWTDWFRDDTDNRGGGCRYHWMIEQVEDVTAPFIQECRICFQEIEGSSQCQGTRNSCSGWSISNPSLWTAWFRDDTDNRGGGCKYQWMLQCR